MYKGQCDILIKIGNKNNKNRLIINDFCKKYVVESETQKLNRVQQQLQKIHSKNEHNSSGVAANGT